MTWDMYRTPALTAKQRELFFSVQVLHGDSYHPGQATDALFPLLDFVPRWFIIFGPASGTEALEARLWWPSVKVLGLEPSRAGHLAAEKTWPPPPDSTLLNCAGWESDGTVNFWDPGTPCHGGCFADELNEDNSADDASVPVPCRSLDSLDAEFGPFEDAVLWADVECSERPILRGGARMLRRGAVRAVNLEVRREHGDEIARMLLDLGFVKRLEYLGGGRGYRDEVWLRRDAT